jgi:hypothetical protein
VGWAEDQWVSVSVDGQGIVYTNDDLDAIEQNDPDRFEALEVRQERR